MCLRQFVLALLTVHVGLTHAWDLAISLGHELQFYTNGIKTNTVYFKSYNLTTIIYDEIHNQMLFVDKQCDYDAICGYNLSSEDIRCFVKRRGGNIHDLAIESNRDVLFFTDTKEKSINWISLNNQESNVYGNVMIKMNDRIPVNIGVDSCNEYIYWSNQYIYRKPASSKFFMERAELFSSETQGIYQFLQIHTFAIDPQTQTNYFVSGFGLFNKAPLKAENFNHQNKVILKFSKSPTEKLTVSKDYIYWVSYSRSHKTVWQILKNATRLTVKPKRFIEFSNRPTLGIATNYRIKDQVQGLQDCELLSTLIQAAGTSTELYEVTETDQTTEFYEPGSDQTGYETTELDWTTELYESSGETGQTAELYQSSYIEESTVVDETTENDWITEFYESSEDTGQTAELYQSSYMEETTEVDETTETEWTAETYQSSYMEETTEIDETTETEWTSETYESSYMEETTEVDETTETEWTAETYQSSYTEEFQTDSDQFLLLFSPELNQSSFTEATTELDETTDSCEVLGCLNYCFQGNCDYDKKGHPVCRCNAGYSGERCEVNLCHSYCLNDGDCSLNEEDEPVCECVGNYEGSRCEAVKNAFTFTVQLSSGKEEGIKVADLLSKTITKISYTVEVI